MDRLIQKRKSVQPNPNLSMEKTQQYLKVYAKVNQMLSPRFRGIDSLCEYEYDQ
jgi:hypothetical protein